MEINFQGIPLKTLLLLHSYNPFVSWNYAKHIEYLPCKEALKYILYADSVAGSRKEFIIFLNDESSDLLGFSDY